MNNSTSGTSNNLTVETVFSLCLLSNLGQLFNWQSDDYINENTPLAINDALGSCGLPGGWELAWVGIDISLNTIQNVMYIAYSSDCDTYVIGISGTNSTNLYDLFGEDGSAVAAQEWSYYPAGANLPDPAPMITNGFNNGLSVLIGMTAEPFGSPSGTQAVTAFEYLSGQNATNVYVAGHSLGGTLASMYALYLYSMNTSLNIQCLCLAALTGGDANFVKYYNSIPMLYNQTTMVWNTMDFYQALYVSGLLKNLKALYADPAPGITWDTKNDALYDYAVAAASLHGYTQMSPANVVTFTSPIYTATDSTCPNGTDIIDPTTYMGQATCQHVPAYAYNYNIVSGFLTNVTNTIQKNYPGVLPCIFFTDGFSNPAS